MLPHLEIVDSLHESSSSWQLILLRCLSGISGLYSQLFYLHSPFHAVGHRKHTVLNRYFPAEIVIDELWYRSV